MKQPFSINGNIEIVKDGVCVLNKKRIELLKMVKKLGSINAASRELKMSYQQAWYFIKEMNEYCPLPVVARQRGGTNGGGAELTGYGEKTIREFEKLMHDFEAYKGQLSHGLWLCFF